MSNWTVRVEGLCGQMPRGHKQAGRQARSNLQQKNTTLIDFDGKLPRQNR